MQGCIISWDVKRVVSRIRRIRRARLEPTSHCGCTTHFATAPGLAPGVQRLMHYFASTSAVVQKPLNPRHKAGGVQEFAKCVARPPSVRRCKARNTLMTSQLGMLRICGVGLRAWLDLDYRVDRGAKCDASWHLLQRAIDESGI